MSLHWITDEEIQVELSDEPEPGRPGKPRSRHWLMALLLLFLVVLLLYAQQRRRIQIREAELAEEIEAVYHLWELAVQDGDEELFVGLLNRAHATWQRDQQQLFQTGRLFGRESLGLTASGTATIEAVDLEPDWQAAVVLAGRAYKGTDASGREVTVRLRQPVRLERSGFRWLVSPLPTDYWGETAEISGERVTITTPVHDLPIAQRLHSDLETELAAMCAELEGQGMSCPADTPVNIHFETAPSALAKLPDLDTPAFFERSYVLPAPSLVGLPADDNAYQLLYRGYTGRILHTYRHSLALPTPLPDQRIATLCFPVDGNTLKLFTYDPAGDVWTAELPECSFRYLTGWWGGEGVILQEYGRSLGMGELRLLRWQRGEETLLYSGTNTRRLTRPVSWTGPDGQPHLLLHEVPLNHPNIFSTWLDTEACDATGCERLALPGHTVWSADGQHTIVAQRRMLSLGDAYGEPHTPLEAGFNAFWLDADTYGYVRFAQGEQGQTVVELVTADVGEHRPEVRLRSTDLPVPGSGHTFFIDYVTLLPGSDHELLLAGSSPDDYQEDYFVFRVDLNTEPAVATLQIHFPERPRSHPGTLTSTGFPPFSLSPNGRWLLSTFIDPAGHAWTLTMHGLAGQESYTVTTHYPPYPSHYPYYDWSADGNWLLIGDDGFLRLVAPDFAYERLVPHDYVACLFNAWIQ